MFELQKNVKMFNTVQINVEMWIAVQIIVKNVEMWTTVHISTFHYIFIFEPKFGSNNSKSYSSHIIVYLDS